MGEKMENKEISQEQIDAWKKQHGDIYAIKVDGKTAYLKKPDRKKQHDKHIAKFFVNALGKRVRVVKTWT